MKNFIVPADMTNEQVDELGVEMTMSILFNALCELPSEQIENLLEKSRDRECRQRCKSLSVTQPNDLLKSMMYQSMSLAALHNLMSEIARYKQKSDENAF